MKKRVWYNWYMKFILTGNPLSTNHIYRHAGHRVYMTQEGVNLKTSYQWQLKSQYKKKPMEGDVKVELELFFGDNRKRDIDNYHKILLDAFSGILWEDDSQIIKLTTIKNKDLKNPRIEINI